LKMNRLTVTAHRKKHRLLIKHKSMIYETHQQSICDK
jgi:hypothetical protein